MKKHAALLREKLRQAFAVLREVGYVAKENYLCCTTCASHGVMDECVKTGSIGGVYWHQQDDERIDHSKDVTIGFAANCEDAKKRLMETDWSDRTISEESVLKEYNDECDKAGLTVARAAVSVFEKVGLHVDWNGKCSQKIGVSIGKKNVIKAASKRRVKGHGVK